MNRETGNKLRSLYGQILLGLGLLNLLAATASAAPAATGLVPLFFQTNQSGRPEFIARGHNYQLFITPSAAHMILRKADQSETPDLLHRSSRATSTRSLRLQFVGANAQAVMSGDERIPGNINYFLGDDPAGWRVGVPAFSRVKVVDLYPGINLLYHENRQRLEYDLIVRPGAVPDNIAIRFDEADHLEITPSGNLLVGIGDEQIQQPRPTIYQLVGQKRVEVDGSFQKRDSRTVSFSIGSYDRQLPLIIDPVLTYSSFLGRLANDTARAIARDQAGNIYVAGDTLSTQLGTENAFQPIYAGGYPAAAGDAFVAKFDATGSNLLFLTYVGGSGDDAATSLAVDQEGNAYITGVTDSTNFPIPGFTVNNRIGGNGELYFGLHPYDAFVAKLSADGSQLIYATYLGGADLDEGLGIAVDSAACAYVTGFTQSKNFPVTTNAYQSILRGVSDAFVTKIASNGLSFIYSTLLGGTNTDQGQSIAVDSIGRAYVTGFTTSTNFPVSTNAFQTNRPLEGLPSQAFVTILDRDGASVLHSTLLGGLGSTVGLRIVLDNQTNVYVTGSEDGPGFPVTPGKINPGGVFKSVNGAATWAPSNFGLLHNDVGGIGIDPVNNANLYAGTGRGIARSTNAGALWQVSLDSFDQIVTFAIDPVEPSTIYAGGSQVLKSTNSGASWFQSSTGLVTSANAPTNTFAAIKTLAIDPLAPATIYAATFDGIFKTLNAAATWHRSGLPHFVVNDLILDPAAPSVLYAATSGGVFRSTNSGASWLAFSQGLTNSVAANALTLDSASPPTAYVGLADGSLYKRAQTDTNWTLLTTDLVATNILFTNTFSFGSITLLANDPLTPSTLYAGTRGGLFKSLDSGTNWNIVTNGLPALPIAALSISPASPSTLYVGLFNAFAVFDAFLTKFTTDLSSVVYSVTLGGSGTDQGVGLALDPAGDAFVVGSTTSFDFPIFQPIDYPSSFNSGFNDAFVSAVKADGSDFLYSTYLGGSDDDFGRDITVDSATNAWIVGQTFSPDFPTSSAIQPDFLGPSDSFLARISMTSSVVNVSFTTTPPGIPLFLDGMTNGTPMTFQWPVGSYHTIAALPQSAGTNSRYAWISWSDGGDLIHNVAAYTDTTITAAFGLQYFLRMASTNLTVTDTNLAINVTNSGSVTPASGWYDAGTNLAINAIAPANDTFVGWVGSGNGSFSGTNNSAVVTLNEPIIETATFSGPLTNRVKVVINGSGTVSPNYNNQSLKVGNLYTITAAATANMVFSSWTLAGDTIYTPKLTFVMTNGLVLVANFVPSPFGPVAGTYTGLFYNTNAVAFDSSGFFSGNVTDRGKISASLQILGRKYSFSGQFSTLGQLGVVVARSGFSSINVTLQLDLTGTTNFMTGQLTDGTWRAQLIANRSVYSATNPPPLAGKKYTLLFPGPPDSLTEPGGDGFGTVTIDKAGNVIFSGKLADASAVSQKAFLSGNGQWPLYVKLYSGNGVILGWISIADEPDSDLSGLVDWFKLPRPFTSLYPSGFTIQSDAVGSLYSFTNGMAILPLNGGQGHLVLQNGKLSQSITNSFSLDSANRVTSPDKMTLKFTTDSGLFSGSAIDPGTSKSVSFTGAVLQKQNRGGGFFRQADQTGRARIGP